jgi:serine/threonine protein phosphatase PrpC
MGSPKAAITCAAGTDRGLRCVSNHDHFLIAEIGERLRIVDSSLEPARLGLHLADEAGLLVAVADGMRGHPAGGDASKLAIVHILEQFAEIPLAMRPPRTEVSTLTPPPVEAILENCLRQAHQVLLEQALATPAVRGMGTTCTLAYLNWPWLWLAHAGDSRCYLARGDRMSRLTEDHTIAAQLAARGLPDPHHGNSPWSHVLWNALGSDSPSLHVELSRHRLEGGDRVLLCTDGLSNLFSDEHLRRRLQPPSAAEKVCRDCLADAQAAGGQDNRTLVLVAIEAG